MPVRWFTDDYGRNASTRTARGTEVLLWPDISEAGRSLDLGSGDWCHARRPPEPDGTIEVPVVQLRASVERS